ncbi:MAG: hypothetical protein WDM90_19905 [Ferruginibacter sp.]
MIGIKIKYTLFILSIVCIAACNNNDKSNTPVTDTLNKQVTDSAKFAPLAKGNVFDTLYTLSFVKESNSYIDSLSKHKHGIAFIVDTTADSYKITAGYNGDLRFETYYTFTIDKKTKEIKVQDVITGDMVTPAEFEKRHPIANN